jgi:hypothetical protein
MSTPAPPQQDDPDDQRTFEEDEFEVKLPRGESITPEVPLGREAIAAKLGGHIVWTFSLSIAACFIVVFIEIYKNPSQGNVSLPASLELLKAVAAVFSGLLGFVLGFYFRDGGRN